MVELVVFDFDGVIVDSEPLHFEAVRKTLQEINIPLSWEEYCRKYLGYSDIELFPVALKNAGREGNKAIIEGLAAKKAAIFAILAQKKTEIYPGVREFLQELRKSHIPAAICSGALRAEIEMMLAGSGLRDNFVTIVAADDVRAGKPDPEGYKLSMERAGRLIGGKKLTPEKCIAIEDSSWGIQAAKGAGMMCVAVSNSYQREQLGSADRIVDNLREISAAMLDELVSTSD